MTEWKLEDALVVEREEGRKIGEEAGSARISKTNNRRLLVPLPLFLTRKGQHFHPPKAPRSGPTVCNARMPGQNRGIKGPPCFVPAGAAPQAQLAYSIPCRSAA
jgi:hypothetical protein